MPSAPFSGKGYLSMGFALWGPPMLQVRGGLQAFQPMEYRLSAEYMAATTRLGEQYRKRVAAAFQRTHGRSGDTARSVDAQISPGLGAPGEAFVYGVRFGKNIGFVVRPLPSHPIMAHAKKALSNIKTGGPWAGRTENFYGPFGPIAQVTWYQGGPESHSPDPNFFESEQPWLEGEALAEMHHLAPYAKTLWADEMKGRVILAKGGTTIEY